MMTKYDVILADPPWAYGVSAGWDSNTTESGRTAAKHYDVMQPDEIAALPIGDLASDNCAMFLWVTWPNMFNVPILLDAWGFRFTTIAWVWVKLNPTSLGFFTGLGFYTRSNSEPCLLCLRGSMPPAVHDVLSLIVSPVREHSRKPDEQYDKIERLYPGTKKLELFARRARPGWDVWGNEVESDIIMEVEQC